MSKRSKLKQIHHGVLPSEKLRVIHQRLSTVTVQARSVEGLAASLASSRTLLQRQHALNTLIGSLDKLQREAFATFLTVCNLPDLRELGTGSDATPSHA